MTRQRMDHRAPRGIAFVAAIVVVFAMAAMTLALSMAMRTELQASANNLAASQAATIERGAEQYILGLIAQESTDSLTVDESAFTAVPVGDGWFWVAKPNYGDTSLTSFGLTDEGGKLNLNSATREQLLRLPASTDQLADAIVDWRDSDDTPGPSGAESQYYASLPDGGYNAANAPFENIEELSLVRDVTQELLHGTTKSPIGEQSTGGGALFSATDNTRGWYDLVTVYSTGATAPTTGTTRVPNVNDRRQRSQVRDALIAKLGNDRGGQLADASAAGGFIDLFDYANKLKLTAEEFTAVEKAVGFSATPANIAKVNVNTAPKPVLMCLDGLAEGDVDTLLARRQSTTTEESTSLAWVATALGPKAVGLGSQITGSSSRYSAHIVAVSNNGRAFKRVRVVVDAAQSPPQIIYRRDLTDRGWPMEPAMLASIRSGEFASQNSSTSGGGLR